MFPLTIAAFPIGKMEGSLVTKIMFWSFFWFFNPFLLPLQNLLCFDFLIDFVKCELDFVFA